MTPQYSIAHLTLSDAAEFASRLLPLDWEECEALHGEDPGIVLKRAAADPNTSAYGVRRIADDEPMAVLGGYEINADTFGVWLMVTDAFDIPAGVFTRRKMKGILRILGKDNAPCPVTAACLAWVGNDVHQRWLHAAGWRPTGKLVKSQYSKLPFKELTLHVCS